MSGRWRGSTTPRGQGRGGWNRSSGSRAVATIVPPALPLGPLLATVKRHELTDLCSDSVFNAEAPKITKCKMIGSYNWLNRGCPTILIPGCPPTWTPTRSLKKLPQDNGSYFRDQNSARYSTHVFQPALEAIFQQDPGFELRRIDLFACVSTLRGLLRFVTEPDNGLRIVVEVVGSTVFLVRRPNSPTETIENVYGYGHSFPEANTTWRQHTKGSESHQRILQYEFGGISCAIRYEGDGYLPNLYPPSSPNTTSVAVTPDDLLTSIETATLGSAARGGKQTLAILTGGETIPQAAIFDLKTRSTRKEYKDVLKGELPRLWAAQVPNFVVGFHTSGVFDDVRVEDVREEIRNWEEEHEGHLRKLAGLLKTLIAFAHGQLEGRFEIVFEGGDQLELREVGGVVNCCISDSMMKRCAESGLDGETIGGGELDQQEEDGREEEEDEGRSGGWSESESEKDFTACSASSCGYCGHCAY
ncbi:hypothetical protein BDW59DRAFT_62783 [Aspergillus cavernicola]|uniref:Geranylgeranyl pyrophosphate synthetase n=1 Tax=Aspergillus cavernicola TaxID=176166 RepID=A0ABR4IFY0_9EURO